MQRVNLSIFLFVFLQSSMASHMAQMSGKPKFMEYAKDELKGHLAREQYFCRGAYYPEIADDFECKRTGPEEEYCSIKFECQRIMPGKTRLSNMAKYPLSDVGLKSLRKTQVLVDGKGVQFQEKKIYVDAHKVDEVYHEDLNRKKKEQTEYREELKTAGYKSFSKLEEEVARFDTGEIKLEPKDSEEEVANYFQQNLEVDISQASSEEDLVEKELEQELQALKGDEVVEQKSVVKTSTKKQNRKQEAKSNLKTNQEMIRDDHGVFFWGLSYSLINTASDTGSIAQSADFAWSPVIKLTHKWSLRGNLGYHNIKAYIEGEDTAGEESFSVYDFGINFEYTFLDQLYVDGGLGLQSWGSSIGGSYSTVSFGAGYRFWQSKLWVIDQLFLGYTTISNTEANKEIRFGFRSYF